MSPVEELAAAWTWDALYILYDDHPRSALQ
jgi:hypothetical protein